MKNILVALDLEATDDKLIGHALEYAEKFEAKIWILHIAAPEPDFVGYDIGPQYIRDTRAEELKGQHKALHDIVDNLSKKGIPCDALLVAGPTAETIQEEVQKLSIDLLVMGSHKHSFLYETFVGHSSVKLLKKLSIPLLIVPLDE